MLHCYLLEYNTIVLLRHPHRMCKVEEITSKNILYLFITDLIQKKLFF